MNNRKALDVLIDDVLEEEKERFQPGLESYEMYADKVRQKIYDSAEKFQKQYGQGFETVKDILKQKGIAIPQISPEALAILQNPTAFQYALDQGIQIYQLLGFSSEMMQNCLLSATQLLESRDFAKALDVFFFLVTIDHSSLPFWLGLGISYEQLGNYPEAVQAFLRAAYLDPTYINAYEGAIRGLVQQNLHDDALMIYDDALSFAQANKGETWSQPLQAQLMEVKNSIKS